MEQKNNKIARMISMAMIIFPILVLVGSFGLGTCAIPGSSFVLSPNRIFIITAIFIFVIIVGLAMINIFDKESRKKIDKKSIIMVIILNFIILFILTFLGTPLTHRCERSICPQAFNCDCDSHVNDLGWCDYVDEDGDIQTRGVRCPCGR